MVVYHNTTYGCDNSATILLAEDISASQVLVGRFSTVRDEITEIFLILASFRVLLRFLGLAQNTI
jgi:hypothetical protein